MADVPLDFTGSTETLPVSEGIAYPGGIAVEKDLRIDWIRWDWGELSSMPAYPENGESGGRKCSRARF